MRRAAAARPPAAAAAEKTYSEQLGYSAVVVATQPLPADLREPLPLIGACIGGASLVDDLKAMLTAAGFTRVDLELKGASKKFIAQWGEDPRVADFLVSAIITAWKP